MIRKEEGTLYDFFISFTFTRNYVEIEKWKNTTIWPGKDSIMACSTLCSFEFDENRILLNN